jgi:hypothetical protein
MGGLSCPFRQIPAVLSIAAANAMCLHYVYSYTQLWKLPAAKNFNKTGHIPANVTMVRVHVNVFAVERQ